MRLPRARGPLSEGLFALLCRPAGSTSPDDLPRVTRRAVAAADRAGTWFDDEDLQLTLWVLYEQHYRGFDDVDGRWEWDPGLLAARAVIEGSFETALYGLVPRPAPVPAAELPQALFDLTAADDGPSLSSHMARRADVEQWRELVALKSVYHLKEADPHTWVIPRLHGAAKAALVEIQSDEYGGGRPHRMHSELFRRMMRALGLDDRYGCYVETAPAATLANVNAMSLLGLHRRLRGYAIGHLTAVEMTSSVPSRLYANGLRRLGFDAGATWFFDEHVEADSAHEQIAARDMCGSLVAEEPGLTSDVLHGAALGLAVDAIGGRRTLAAWEQGSTALRRPLDLPTSVPA